MDTPNVSADQQLLAEPLFVGATRPPMRWGVTYSALLVNLMVTMEAFLATRNLLMLLVALPLHGLCVLLCLRDARIFDLLMLWCRTGASGMLGTRGDWGAVSYAPLAGRGRITDGSGTCL